VTADQLGELLGNVPLEQVTVSLDAGSNALAVAACFLHAARARNVAPASLRAWLNADPLGALARDGALPFSLETAREQLCALSSWAVAKAPSMRSVTVSTVPHHDAGAHCVQEVAYALATAVTYLRWLTEAGLSVLQASSQLAFSFAIGSDLFMEIAKLRAFRQCFARVVEACGGDADAQRAPVHATTSTRTKTARDPWVNLLRETTEAFAAAAGGADAITTSGFDRLLGSSDAFGRRLAANTQVILDQEAHVARVADPAGGSFYVEALTDAIAQAAWHRLQALEAAGGMQQALLGGTVAAEIEEVARARAAAYATRKQAITGVSEFALCEEPVLARGEPDWNAVTAQRQSALARASREESVAKGVAQAHARGAEAWVEAAVEAAGRGATLGQLSCSLASPGEPARARALVRMRHAAPYEQLRDASDARTRATGKRPSVFLCNLGPIPEHKARAQFASGFFAAGGFAVSDNDGFADVEAAIAGFVGSRAELVVLCGSDEAYPRLVAALAPRLREAGAKQVLLAGRPGEHEAAYRAAGIARFIFVGCDVVATLHALLAELGVTT
jgi:methylmalonyl-CoA mutase